MIASERARQTIRLYGQAITAMHKVGVDPFDIATALHLSGANDVLVIARLARTLEDS